MVEVIVKNASDLNEVLNEAIDFLAPSTMVNRVGVMVTRIGAGHYVVRAHPEVPFGLVRQRYE
ncbi:hypothetical protein AYX19_21565 (plasmid) [Paenarthrobacter ureafaciens]|nr:hypothetical protein AYX22_22190 [Arthrobacter sp. D5-1]QSZ55595.1 hypothetical protein AYX19_21095 [Paenarthrobacter ureafaciens]QSZ55677.1 hypothetical protein AYX19_21565 [Paenarthrobacter ureafaciens]